VQAFDGDLDDYSRWLVDFRARQEPGLAAGEGAAVDKTDRKAQRQAAAALRQQLAPLKKAADKLEAELGKLQERLAALEARLGDSGLYDAARKEELRQALADQAAAKTREAELEEQWLEALERLESLQAELEGA